MRGRTVSLRLLMASILALTMASIESSAEAANEISPMRLRVKVEKSTLLENEVTTLTVLFLDKYNEQIKNDKDREITFKVTAVGNTSRTAASSATVTPNRVRVKAGAQSATAGFRGRRIGRLQIEVHTAGVADAKTYVAIVRRTTSMLHSFVLQPVAYYLPNIEITLLPKDAAAPADNYSPAEIGIFFDPVLTAAQKIQITMPADCSVVLKSETERHVGGTTFNVLAGAAVFEGIRLYSAKPGRKQVVASLVEGDAQDQAEVEFNYQLPRSIDLTGERGPFIDQPLQISPSRPSVALEVRVKSDVEYAVGALENEMTVDLTASVDSSIAYFDPPTIVLAKENPVSYPTLHVKDFLSPHEFQVRALARGTAVIRPGDGRILVEAGAPKPPMLLVLTVFSLFGGIIGATSRSLYKTGVKYILPKREDGRITPGLVVDSLMGAPIGVLFFEMVKLGVIGVAGQGRFVETSALSFCFGMIGGFGGILVLERLLGRFLGGAKETPTNPL